MARKELITTIAMVGTVVLLLPIAVVGLMAGFDNGIALKVASMLGI